MAVHAWLVRVNLAAAAAIAIRDERRVAVIVGVVDELRAVL